METKQVIRKLANNNKLLLNHQLVARRSFHVSVNVNFSRNHSLLNNSQLIEASSKSIETELCNIRSQMTQLRSDMLNKAQNLKKVKQQEKEKAMVDVDMIKSERYLTAETIYAITKFHLIMKEETNPLDSAMLSKGIEQARKEFSELSSTEKEMYLQCEKVEKQKYIAKLESIRDSLNGSKKKLPVSLDARIGALGNISDSKRAQLTEEYELDMLNF